MKKILIVNGSKRRKGNSYALESYILEKLKENQPRNNEYCLLSPMYDNTVPCTSLDVSPMTV